MAGVGDIIAIVESGITIAQEIKKFYDAVQEAEGALGNLIDDLKEVQDIAKQFEVDISGGTDRKLSPKGDSLIKNCRRYINLIVTQLEHLRPKGKLTLFNKVEYWWRLDKIESCNDLTQKLYTRLQILYTIFKKEPGWQKEATQYIEEFAKIRRRRMTQRSARTNTGFDAGQYVGNAPVNPGTGFSRPRDFPGRGYPYADDAEIIDLETLKDFEAKAFQRGRDRERADLEEREEIKRAIIENYEKERTEKETQDKTNLERIRAENVANQAKKEAENKALFEEWSRAMKAASKSQGAGVARGVGRLLARISPNSTGTSSLPSVVADSDDVSSVNTSRGRGRRPTEDRIRDPKSFADIIKYGSVLPLSKEDFRPWLEDYMDSLYVYLVDRSGEVHSFDEVDRFAVIEYISKKTKSKPALTAQIMAKMPSWLRASVMQSVVSIRRKLETPALEILWCEPMPAQSSWNPIRRIQSVRGAFVVLAERDGGRRNTPSNTTTRESDSEAEVQSKSRPRTGNDRSSLDYSRNIRHKEPDFRQSTRQRPEKWDTDRRYHLGSPDGIYFDSDRLRNDRGSYGDDYYGFYGHENRSLYRERQRPVWTRIHRRHVRPETLEFYGLPYFRDPKASDYLIIAREMSQMEADVLFEHTARSRQMRHERSRAHRRSYETLSSPERGRSKTFEAGVDPYWAAYADKFGNNTIYDDGPRVYETQHGRERFDRERERQSFREGRFQSRRSLSRSSSSANSDEEAYYFRGHGRTAARNVAKERGEFRRQEYERELEQKLEKEKDEFRRQGYERELERKRAFAEPNARYPGPSYPGPDYVSRSRVATDLKRKSIRDELRPSPTFNTTAALGPEEAVIDEDDLDFLDDAERDPKQFFESLTIDVNEEKRKEKETGISAPLSSTVDELKLEVTTNEPTNTTIVVPSSASRAPDEQVQRPDESEESPSDTSRSPTPVPAAAPKAVQVEEAAEPEKGG